MAKISLDTLQTYRKIEGANIYYYHCLGDGTMLVYANVIAT